MPLLRKDPGKHSQRDIYLRTPAYTSFFSQSSQHTIKRQVSITPRPPSKHTRKRKLPDLDRVRRHSNQTKCESEVSTTRHQTAGYSSSDSHTSQTYPGAADLELGRVRRLVVLDLHRLGIAAVVRQKTVPNTDEWTKRHGKKRQADETERMCIHSGGDTRFNMMTSRHDLKIHTSKREGSRASTQAPSRSTTAHQICTPSPKIKDRRHSIQQSRGGLTSLGRTPPYVKVVSQGSLVSLVPTTDVVSFREAWSRSGEGGREVGDLNTRTITASSSP